MNIERLVGRANKERVLIGPGVKTLDRVSRRCDNRPWADMCRVRDAAELVFVAWSIDWFSPVELVKPYRGA